MNNLFEIFLVEARQHKNSWSSWELIEILYFFSRLHFISLHRPTPSPFAEEDTEAPTTVSTLKKIEKVGSNVTNFVADKTHIPSWGVVAIFVLILLIILGICGFCIRRFFKKRRSKDGKKGMKGVDMKSVQLLGSAYKEKVNIIMSIFACLACLRLLKIKDKPMKMI